MKYLEVFNCYLERWAEAGLEAASNPKIPTRFLKQVPARTDFIASVSWDPLIPIHPLFGYFVAAYN